jgi:uncharacterized protein
LKTSLSYLPAYIQEDLQSITEAIVRLTNPEMVILFGSYARGTHTKPINGSLDEYKSDYDILVITQHPFDPPGFNKDLNNEEGREMFPQLTTIQAIFHDIVFLRKELREHNYFFVDILREGVMLYMTGNFQLK